MRNWFVLQDFAKAKGVVLKVSQNEGFFFLDNDLFITFQDAFNFGCLGNKNRCRNRRVCIKFTFWNSVDEDLVRRSSMVHNTAVAVGNKELFILIWNQINWNFELFSNWHISRLFSICQDRTNLNIRFMSKIQLHWTNFTAFDLVDKFPLTIGHA